MRYRDSMLSAGLSIVLFVIATSFFTARAQYRGPLYAPPAPSIQMPSDPSIPSIDNPSLDVPSSSMETEQPAAHEAQPAARAAQPAEEGSGGRTEENRSYEQPSSSYGLSAPVDTVTQLRSDCMVNPTADVVVEACTALISMEPSNPAAFFHRGWAYYQKNQDDRAIENYDEAIQLDPTYPDFYYFRALAYLHDGQFNNAIENFTQALAIQPNLAKAFRDRGWTYHMRGIVMGNESTNTRLALRDLNRAIAIDSVDAKAFAFRGFVKSDTGDQVGAAADWRQAGQLDPRLK